MRTTAYRFPPSCPLKDGFPPTNAAMETQRKEMVFQIPARFENPASFGMPLHTGLAHFGVEMPGFIATGFFLSELRWHDSRVSSLSLQSAVRNRSSS